MAIPGYYVILENVFGFIGTGFWSFQLAPQAYKNWQRKSTKGLAQAMIFLWAMSGVCSGTYAIILKLSIPLIIEPQLFTAICLFIYVQFFYYDSPKLKGNKIKIGILFVLLIVLVTGIETGAVYGIRYANEKNIGWPETTIGIVAVALVVTGFIPQYIEIYRDKRVLGISLMFMAFDMSGALFSVLSLVFHPPPFDTLASFLYISVFVLDGIIVFLYYFLNRYHARKESAIQNRNEEMMVETVDP